jgi:hypothetical protein
VIARMKRGIAIDRAERDLTLVNQRLQAAYPQKFNRSRVTAQTRVVELHDRLVVTCGPPCWCSRELSRSSC